MIIHNIKNGKELEVMAGTVVPKGFVVKGENAIVKDEVSTNATNVALTTEKSDIKMIKKSKKGANKHGKDEWATASNR